MRAGAAHFQGDASFQACISLGSFAWLPTCLARLGLFGSACALAGSWEQDDAWLVDFITNDQIAKRVQAKLDEYDTTLDEVGFTVGELAYQMQLP